MNERISTNEKLKKIFGEKWLVLFGVFEKSNSPLDKEEFETLFSQYWGNYLNSLGCQLMSTRKLVEAWKSRRDIFYIEDPNYRKSWIVLDAELAVKIFVLGLP